MAKRLKMEIRGAVQGVGFRPFVYRLATGLGLSGWVLNDIRGVFLEVEGDAERLSAFRERLRVEAPPRARIQDLSESWLDPVGYEGFQIRTSEAKGTKTVLVLPDIATCPDCLAEVLDPGRSPLPVPVRQLHELRAALHDRQRPSLRSPEHHDARLHALRRVPGGVREPSRPPLSRAADGLSRLRAAARGLDQIR